MMTQNNTSNPPEGHDSIKYDFFNKPPDDFTNGRFEDELSWFTGSLIASYEANLTPDSAIRNQFRRLSTLHNRITHGFTSFDQRYVSIRAVAYQLSEFFPLKWMTEIIRHLRETKIPITCLQDRYIQVLGFMELFLNFRSQKILHSTLDEINQSYDLHIQMSEIRKFKILILRKIPELREKYIQFRSKTQQAAFIGTIIQTMNKDMVPGEDWSRKEIFLIKQNCLKLARQFTTFKRANHIKKGEIWSQAICLRAVRQLKEGYSVVLLFPSFDAKVHKVIENKRWHLDNDFERYLEI